MSHHYKTARSLLSFVEVASWVGVVLGFIVAFVSFSIGRNSGFGSASNMAGLIAAMPGAVLMFLGVLSVAYVQVGRAGVDTAEMTDELLQLSRKQFEIASSSHALFERASAAAKTPVRQTPTRSTTSTGKSSESATVATQQSKGLNGADHQQASYKPNWPAEANKPAIENRAGVYVVNGQQFRTEQAAIEYRDSLS